MLILSISSLETQGAAALVEGGRLVAAATESRARGRLGFPSRAVETVLRRAGRRASEVDLVAWPFFGWKTEVRQLLRGIATELPDAMRRPGTPLERARHARRHAEAVASLGHALREGDAALSRGLGALGLSDRLRRVEFHLALHAAAFHGSGFRRTLLVSLDHAGSGLSGAVAIGGEGGIERLHPFPYPHSFGAWNDQVAAALGIGGPVPEPAIAGLAARGDPNVLRDRIRARIQVTEGDFHLGAALDETFFQRLAARYTPAEVAAAWQAVQEDVAVEVIGHYVERHHTENLAVAGRVFANPKLNWRLSALPGVKSLFAHPAVGIEAATLGAGLWLASQAGTAPPRRAPLMDMALGQRFSDATLAEALGRAGLAVERPDDLAGALAARIAAGGAVARFSGPLEFGDRALGQRSVLFSAADAGLADWVGARLGRSPGTPYACMVDAADAATAFEGTAVAGATARFGACTLPTRADFRAAHPVVVNADDTACPRIVDAETEPMLHAMLAAHRERTGRIALAHTGLRLPGEALVSTPDEAIRAFQLGHLDALALGPFWVERPAQPS
jgi:carbamoyltransferase